MTVYLESAIDFFGRGWVSFGKYFIQNQLIMISTVMLCTELLQLLLS